MQAPGTALLFGLAVFVWGTTWHAIVYQLAETSPAEGVTLRFALAGLAGLAIAAWRSRRHGERWTLSGAEHAHVALQGVFMYSLSYLCVYHAERHVASGLVAIGYSLSPLINGIAVRWIWGTPLSRRFLAGGLLGALGVVLIFWPELAALRWADASLSDATTALASDGTGPANTAASAGAHVPTGHTVLGLVFTLGAVALSSVGSLSASRNRSRGLPFWAALGWGMLYGAACSALLTTATDGWRPGWPTSAAWWLSLLYLSLAGSLVAFACYLTLQQRLGPGPASTVGVATPVLALLMSWGFEGYQPGWLSLAGVVLAMVGNALALGLIRPRARLP